MALLRRLSHHVLSSDDDYNYPASVKEPKLDNLGNRKDSDDHTFHDA